MAASKHVKALRKLRGAITEYVNPHNNVIRCASPSLNSTFGNNWGLPIGYSVARFGPPKGGKSLLFYCDVAWLHQNDPDAIAVKFDTEYREEGQMSPAMMKAWGIDPDRYVVIQSNDASDVFDQIRDDITAMIQEGAPIKLVGIDSINGIVGRRQAETLDKKGIKGVTIGDMALTIQDGMKSITKARHDHKFALVVTVQVRAEMDTLEQMRGNDVKMAASYGLKHHAEYFQFVERNKNKAGKQDLQEQSYEDKEGGTDILGHADQSRFRIRVTMKESSMGPQGRMGECAIDMSRGIVDTHEEALLLGLGRRKIPCQCALPKPGSFPTGCEHTVIARLSQQAYAIGDKKWTGGKPAIIAALRDDPALVKAVIDEVKVPDLEDMRRGQE